MGWRSYETYPVSHSTERNGPSLHPGTLTVELRFQPLLQMPPTDLVFIIHHGPNKPQTY